MCGRARAGWSSVQRAWIAGLSVRNRASMPAEWRLRLQTGAGTVFSAFAGKRSKGRAVSAQPFPSTPQSRTSCQTGASCRAPAARGRRSDAAPAAPAPRNARRPMRGRVMVASRPGSGLHRPGELPPLLAERLFLVPEDRVEALAGRPAGAELVEVLLDEGPVAPLL